jgi:hypothetical protein
MQKLQKGNLASGRDTDVYGRFKAEGVVTELTSRTFTLLRSDIEGSTQLLERLATSMSSS